MRKLLFYIFSFVALVGSVTAVVAGGRQRPYTVLNGAEMRQVVGGGCEICYDQCSGTGCVDSRCGEDDKDEYCGSAENKTAKAWECLPWGTSESACKKLGVSNCCHTKGCHCQAKENCTRDSSYKDYSGNTDCTDKP